MDKKTLLESIIPLYNLYKDRKNEISPLEALGVMWDIGEHIRSYLESHKVKPHALYREIYGKAEGSVHIVQKSYITREFQSRCFRIRNIFDSKDQIRKDFPRLNNFTAFREAMPFFDNPKYMLRGAERESLLKLLNGTLKQGVLIKKIRKLQSLKINKKNPRTQKLQEMESVKQNFIVFYNHIYNLIKLSDYNLMRTKIGNVSSDFIRDLAKVTASLCQEGLKIDKLIPPNNLDQTWMNYSSDIVYLSSQKDPKQRRRLRRIMPPERIIRLADMLYALINEDSYRNLR